MTEQYWDTSEITPPMSVKMGLRAKLAFDLIRVYATVAGKPDGEDASGRSRLGLQTPEELVARAFAIADVFVATAENRGEIKPVSETDVAAAFRRAGELHRVRNRAEYPKMEELEKTFGESSEMVKNAAKYDDK